MASNSWDFPSYKPGWRRYESQDSATFLINNVHQKVIHQYSSTLAGELAQRQQAYAKELQYYLQQLKNYVLALKEKKQANFFVGEEWNLFINTLKTIRTKDHNSKLQTLFGAKEGKTHRFEKDIQQIVQAIQKSYKPSFKGHTFYGGTIHLGQKTTNISFSQQDFATPIGQQIMEFYGVKTLKHFESVSQTSLKGLQPVSVKIDSAGGNTIVELDAIFDISKIIPNFSRFCELMLSATFSQKNYQTLRQVKLQQTQGLRILFDLLPQLIINFNSEQYIIAFIFALSQRLMLNNVHTQPHTTDKEAIYKVFGELDFIYRLTGRGQTYDTDFQQLNKYLQQGAKYLLYNETKGSKIYVNSTRWLIYQKFKQLENSGRSFRFGHSMQISKGLIKGKGYV